MTTVAAIPKGSQHPARYSKAVLEAATWLLADVSGVLLDCFGGEGLIHLLGRPDLHTVSMDIEPNFVAAPTAIKTRSLVANAKLLPFAPNSIDVGMTSVTYANRMADTYMGDRDRCIPCKQAIANDERAEPDPDCADCRGTGFKPSKRMTYTIANGGPLHPDNSGGMQWGKDYRELHRATHRAMAEVLKPNAPFIVNVSNHIRAGQLQRVAEWHLATLMDIGFGLIKATPVKTPRYGLGANSRVRTDAEMLLVVSAPDEPNPETLF